MKKIIAFLLIFSFVFPSSPHAQDEKRNVIFMVMDGTNSDVITLARHYKGAPLALDGMLAGGVKTYSLHSAITDSAAAATAMATGHKTIMDMIGMIPYTNPNGLPKGRPVANVLEAAHEKGMATGIIATAPVQHATPAAFSAHTFSRHRMTEIGLQQAHQNIDVLMGGGKKFQASQKSGDVPVVFTKEEMARAKGQSLHGFFADEDMAYDLDREKLRPEQPSLAEMTKVALNNLSKSPAGFFLFVEGSKVDFAGHKNDPVGMVSEVLAFDHAVQEALDFAKKHPNTLLIAVADHGNSGLTMGNRKTDQSYADSAPARFIDPLKKASLTVTGALSQLKKDRSNLNEVLRSYGLDHLTTKQMKELKKENNLEGAMVQLMAEQAHLGFTTRGHSGEDIFLYAYGPNKPAGLINNTELADIVVNHLGLMPLSDLTKKRFRDATQYYREMGYTTSIKVNQQEAVFTAAKENVYIEYPANQNVKITNGKKETLKGINVFNGESFWIPGE